MQQPMRVLIIEDEMLLTIQLETYIEDAGHIVVGTALSSREAIALAGAVEADIALVDVHLLDGPTGVDVGRYIAQQTNVPVVFMTANPKRIPDDFSGAIGVIAKPYTQEGVSSALQYLVAAVLNPPPRETVPRSLALAPAFAQKWETPPAIPYID